eukprot:GHVS01001936.1.p1 GENE.GHVS01001936.1~~GHVS01001936.1.p1  ORF type:complete len:378 (-),score=102.01 GHVS01001936.1:2-1135(-)
MTEFWVSQAKHYCKICKIWVSGHAQNIKRHELTDVHLMKAREQLKEMRKKDAEQEMAVANEIKEIRRMEKAASQHDDSVWFGGQDTTPPEPPQVGPLTVGGDEEEVGERPEVVERKVKRSKVLRAPPLAGDGWELRGDVFDGCPINKQQRICARIATAMGQQRSAVSNPLPPSAATALTEANTVAVGHRTSRHASTAEVDIRSTSISVTAAQNFSSNIVEGSSRAVEVSSRSSGAVEGSSWSSSAVEGSSRADGGRLHDEGRADGKVVGVVTIGEWQEVVDPSQSAFGDVVKGIKEEGGTRSRVELPPSCDGGNLSMAALEMLADTERRPILNATDLKAEAKPVYWDKPSMQSDRGATVAFAKRTKPKLSAKRTTLR